MVIPSLQRHSIPGVFFMKNHSLEWIHKASGDLATAQRELRARKNPNYDAACFHAQQCTEKALKAVMSEKCLHIVRTHDLEVLLDGCLESYPLWESFRLKCQLLTQYAVLYRYPGEEAVKEEAREAVAAAKAIYEEILQALCTPSK
jgi:HEPN domain-containing protein